MKKLLIVLSFTLLSTVSFADAFENISDFERGFNEGKKSISGRVIQAIGIKSTYTNYAKENLRDECSDGIVKQIICSERVKIPDGVTNDQFVCSGLCINR